MNRLLTGLVLITALWACRENKSRQDEEEAMRTGMERIEQDVQETADAAADYLGEQKRKAAEDLEERRKEIDQELRELKSDGSEKAKEARKKLTGLRNDINRKLDEVKSASADTWDSTRLEQDTLLKKSDREWTEFKQEFKELFR